MVHLKQIVNIGFKINSKRFERTIYSVPIIEGVKKLNLVQWHDGALALYVVDLTNDILIKRWNKLEKEDVILDELSTLVKILKK